MDETKKTADEFVFDGTEHDTDIEPELEAIEESSNDKIKLLRERLKQCEQDKIANLEEVQRAKAEFLNARKRIEGERAIEKERITNNHIEELLPLYDSFAMAMANKEAWEAIDKNWRSGVEAIYTQLKSLLQSYHVREVSPLGKHFDPEHHEAMGSEPVTDQKDHDTIVRVIQVGFVRTTGMTETTIRPARVIVGNYSANNES